jgi:protocatechuate 3,4-dioxygenase, beta subunit
VNRPAGSAPTEYRLPHYRRTPPEDAPTLLYPDYRSTVLRTPLRPPIELPQRLTEITGPVLGEGRVGARDHDLTAQHAEEPIGQRIVVHGRVLDGNGRGVPNTLIEIWQANACGRYRHENGAWGAPLDPNFDGLGRVISDADGWYRFITIRPGAYPWTNHPNAWRPAHIHFSLFGRAFTQRLVTQMYFPDDSLFFQDPIFNSVTSEEARRRMISSFDLSATEPEWALGYRFDLVLVGSDITPFESGQEDDE